MSFEHFQMRFENLECPTCGNDNEDNMEIKSNGEVICDECRTRIKKA